MNYNKNDLVHDVVMGYIDVLQIHHIEKYLSLFVYEDLDLLAKRYAQLIHDTPSLVPKMNVLKNEDTVAGRILFGDLTRIMRLAFRCDLMYESEEDITCKLRECKKMEDLIAEIQDVNFTFQEVEPVIIENDIPYKKREKLEEEIDESTLKQSDELIFVDKDLRKIYEEKEIREKLAVEMLKPKKDRKLVYSDDYSMEGSLNEFDDIEVLAGTSGSSGDREVYNLTHGNTQIKICGENAVVVIPPRDKYELKNGWRPGFVDIKGARGKGCTSFMSSIKPNIDGFDIFTFALVSRNHIRTFLAAPYMNEGRVKYNYTSCKHPFGVGILRGRNIYHSNSDYRDNVTVNVYLKELQRQVVLTLVYVPMKSPTSIYSYRSLTHPYVYNGYTCTIGGRSTYVATVKTFKLRKDDGIFKNLDKAMPRFTKADESDEIDRPPGIYVCCFGTVVMNATKVLPDYVDIAEEGELFTRINGKGVTILYQVDEGSNYEHSDKYIRRCNNINPIKRILSEGTIHTDYEFKQFVGGGAFNFHALNHYLGICNEMYHKCYDKKLFDVCELHYVSWAMVMLGYFPLGERVVKGRYRYVSFEDINLRDNMCTLLKVSQWVQKQLLKSKVRIASGDAFLL